MVVRQSEEEASIKEELGAAVAEPVSVCTALCGASAPATYVHCVASLGWCA